MDATSRSRLTVVLCVLMAMAHSGYCQSQDTSASSAAPSSPLPASRPASRPAKAGRLSRKPAPKIPASVAKALHELTREFQQGNPRTAADYFEKSPDPELTADVALGLLQKRQGGSASMEAYIKWQVLAALPREIPEEYAGDLIAAYRDAPAIEPRPGMSADQKRQLDREIRKSAEPWLLPQRLATSASLVEQRNAPILRYRDELLARMPDTSSGIEACLDDLYRRAEAGQDVGPAGDAVIERLNRWIEQTSSRQELIAMARLLQELRRAEIPTYYDQCHNSQELGLWVWDESRADLNRGHRLDQTLRAISQKTGKQSVESTQQQDQSGRSRDKRRK